MTPEEEREALDALAGRLHQAPRATLQPLPDPPSDLRARTLAAVARDATRKPEPPAVARPSRSRPRVRLPQLRTSLAAGAVLATAIVALVIALPAGDGPPGTLEVSTDLAGRGGAATVHVREIGTGRTVDLDSDSLAILPKGEYYEVWFVGPGDSRRKPNRISAGTFHPDADGESQVLLKAAVDPKKFPAIEVTAEPGDGDPRATGPVAVKTRK